MKASTLTPPTLGVLQRNVESLRAKLNVCVKAEDTASRTHRRAVELTLSTRSALHNSVKELDEAAASFTRSARS